MVIVVNWNNEPDTRACLESVLSDPEPERTVVLVDNGSSDGSGTRIAQEFGDRIVFIQSPKNLGYAGANNLGIRWGMENGYRYFFLLNNDAECQPGVLRRLLRVAEASPRAGVVGPKILYHGTEQVWFAGGRVDEETGKTWHYTSDKALQLPVDVDYVSGCALLVSREVVDAVGLMPEDYFLYYEETEWCTRALRAGFKVLYVPDAVVVHKISRTVGSRSEKFYYYFYRNRVLFVRRMTQKLTARFYLRLTVDLLRESIKALLARDYRPLAAALDGVRAGLQGEVGEHP
ncbi:MAG: glycosyltransferase family 2 protein [Bacillota bacterium]|nr:glycosyltransferase family 2 protein [Bacillota bacterium]